jgi:hypothetical protein
LERFLDKCSPYPEYAHLYLFRSGASSQDTVFGVIYQAFKNQQSALLASKALPSVLGANAPLVRPIRTIRTLGTQP